MDLNVYYIEDIDVRTRSCFISTRGVSIIKIKYWFIKRLKFIPPSKNLIISSDVNRMHVAENSSRKVETCLPDTISVAIDFWSRYTIDRCRVPRYDREWIIRKTEEPFGRITYSPCDTWACKRAAGRCKLRGNISTVGGGGQRGRDTVTLLRLSRFIDGN